jgi:hypothetical protein
MRRGGEREHAGKSPKDEKEARRWRKREHLYIRIHVYTFISTLRCLLFPLPR